MSTTRLGARWRLLADTALELLTSTPCGVCGQRLGALECQRRERHRGRHAQVDSKTAALWGRS